MYARIATNIGAELTMMVAFETEVTFMLQCQIIKSIVNPRDAKAHIDKLREFRNLKKNFLFSIRFKAINIGNANNIL